MCLKKWATAQVPTIIGAILKRQHATETNAKYGNDNNNDNDDSSSRHFLFL
ncbi:hypothetical protein KUC_0045 [Vreelandella boliviensis LC1]|uniref:Uncharacterized protein n=1 Tax=Vreelandella boliviensis LC1 TaxID=1072583 RepID=A0A7U9C4N9_9GAMM|nr:hypothetical protein KUC_0045 [Halomonas boliviensis LC1]